MELNSNNIQKDIQRYSTYLYSSEVRLFGHIYFYRKPFFGNRKYVEGTIPRVWDLFLNICHYEIGSFYMESWSTEFTRPDIPHKKAKI